jgi:hypothetical protein
MWVFTGLATELSVLLQIVSLQSADVRNHDFSGWHCFCSSNARKEAIWITTNSKAIGTSSKVR